MTEGPITMTPPESTTDAGADSTVDARAGASSGSIGPPSSIHAPLTRAEAMRRLDRSSKQGNLPGFEQRGDERFRALVYGDPFDRELLGVIRDDGEGCAIDLELRLLKKTPSMAVALVVISIWPGVWLTDSMIQTYFPGYPNAFWVTAVWYLPLTVIPLPWMMRKMWRKSERIAREELGKTVDRIARAVGGTVI